MHARRGPVGVIAARSDAADLPINLLNGRRIGIATSPADSGDSGLGLRPPPGVISAVNPTKSAKISAKSSHVEGMSAFEATTLDEDSMFGYPSDMASETLDSQGSTTTAFDAYSQELYGGESSTLDDTRSIASTNTAAASSQADELVDILTVDIKAEDGTSTTSDIVPTAVVPDAVVSTPTKKRKREEDAVPKALKKRKPKTVQKNEGIMVLKESPTAGGLYLGNVDHAANWEWLDFANVRAVVNVTKDVKNFFELCPGFFYKRVPIIDSGEDNIKDAMVESADFIHEKRLAGMSVLMHCNVGWSRSVTLTFAYLLQKCNYTLQQCIQLLSDKLKLRWGFEKQLMDLERQLLGGNTHDFFARTRRPSSRTNVSHAASARRSSPTPVAEPIKTMFWKQHWKNASEKISAADERHAVQNSPSKPKNKRILGKPPTPPRVTLETFYQKVPTPPQALPDPPRPPT